MCCIVGDEAGGQSETEWFKTTRSGEHQLRNGRVSGLMHAAHVCPIASGHRAGANPSPAVAMRENHSFVNREAIYETYRLY